METIIFGEIVFSKFGLNRTMQYGNDDMSDEEIEALSV